MTAPMQRRGWGGTTKNTQESGAMLGGKWWTKGDELFCIFQRTFQTKYGEGYEFLLVKPSTITVAIDEYGVATKTGDGEQRILTRFAMPPLAGFEMALQDAIANGFPGLRFSDKVIIKCVEIQEPKEFGHSPMPEFELSIDAR